MLIRRRSMCRAADSAGPIHISSSVAPALSDAWRRAIGVAKRSQRHSWAVYRAPKTSLCRADLVLSGGRQQRCRTLEASPTSPSRSRRPRARLETFLAEAERPRKHPLLAQRIGRRRRKPYVRHARFRGVRQLHSTVEAGEQRQRLAVGGVCGGKEAGQGERRANSSWTGH